ncbi:MAG: hypothetical protein GTO18_01815 [Anaerolineales bacterium]|nr:hypothetical protein [Anaerolineales bacterium]
MSHPFANISPGRISAYLRPLVIITITILIIMNVLDMPLKTDAAPNGIISFELAGDEDTVEAILDSWDKDQQLLASFTIGLDYLFLILYSTTIALGCIWAMFYFRWINSPLFVIGSWLAWFQWLAAIFDSVENASLMIILLGNPISPWAQISRVLAILKFAFVFIGVLYFLVTLLMRTFRRSRR